MKNVHVGSGEKYKNCCKKKKIKYLKSDNENEYTKQIPMHPELVPIFRNEKIKFKKLFGRMPGDNDYTMGGILLKDLNRGYKMIKRKEVVDRAWLYASNKTGLMITEQNQDLIPNRDIHEFKKYMSEYEKLMKSKIKSDECNIIQAVEAISFILEDLVEEKIEDMIYVLNLFVNFYSPEKHKKENFLIQNIKDFLIFCAYKTSINLKALKGLVNQEYYDNSMAVVRIIFEILINIKAYKNDKQLFEEKILPVAGIEKGTHIKINKTEIEEIQTKKRYKYEIQKRQLAEKAGENYKELYTTFYRELSEFIHLDTVAAKKIFQDNDLFCDIDECLVAVFIGMILALEIIMELMEFEGNDNKMSKDIKYFSNVLLKDFIPIIETIISIDDRKEYHILKDTLEEYKTGYKINYQRNMNCEIY